MSTDSPDAPPPTEPPQPPPGTQRAVEAILMVADSPVDLHLLAQVTETSPAVMEQLLADMAAGYAEDDRGFMLVNVAGGYRYQSHPDLTAYVERFVLEGQSARLSSAALETLAIVAYKQPISRAQVASIRGVNVDGVVRTLEQRGYIAEIARDPGPGQAVLFGTTATFLERMGLASLDDLPPVAEFVPGADVVEALEVGLRFEPDEPDVPEMPDEMAEPAAPDDQGPVVDLDAED
jgi:segregation and condensation protein B